MLTGKLVSIEVVFLMKHFVDMLRFLLCVLNGYGVGMALFLNACSARFYVVFCVCRRGY